MPEEVGLFIMQAELFRYLAAVSRVIFQLVMEVTQIMVVPLFTAVLQLVRHVYLQTVLFRIIKLIKTEMPTHRQMGVLYYLEVRAERFLLISAALLIFQHLHTTKDKIFI